MTIRTITINDYDELFRLWSETEGMGLRSLDDSREGIQLFIQRNPGTSFLCLDKGRAMGAILCGHDGRRAYIYHTAVDSAFRGQGVGKRLVKRTLDALRAEGIHKVSLVAYKDNSRGNGFWEALGFSERKDLVYRNLSLNPENE